MTLKMLSISALMFALAAGVAHAQTTTLPDQTAPIGRDVQSSISNPDIVGPMYSD